MNDFIADTYVIFWKHFERQSSTDDDWMASATCVVCGYVAFLNFLQILVFALGKNLAAFYISSKSGQLFVGAVILAIGVQGMRIFLARNPSLKTREEITRRRDRISAARAATIVMLAFANLATLLVLHQFLARR